MKGFFYGRCWKGSLRVQIPHSWMCERWPLRAKKQQIEMRHQALPEDGRRGNNFCVIWEERHEHAKDTGSLRKFFARQAGNMGRRVLALHSISAKGVVVAVFPRMWSHASGVSLHIPGCEFFSYHRRFISAHVSHVTMNHLVMPPQILFDLGHSLISQQLLQTARTSTSLEIPQRKAVTQYLRTHPLTDKTSSSLKPSKEERHPADRQLPPGLGEKEMVFICISPRDQFLGFRTMLLHVGAHLTQALRTQREAARPGSLTSNSHRPMRAVHVCYSQRAQFREADPRVKEHPENGPVASGCSLGQWPAFSWRTAGQQQPVKVFRAEHPWERRISSR